MNHCVPEFEMEDEYSIHSSSAQNRTRKSTVMPGDDDIMELLWQDGQVVVQSQNQRPVKKFPASRYDAVPLPDQSAPREIRPATHELLPQNQNLFMQEDEMASWLHYPLNDAAFDNDFCSDLLYPTPPSSAATAAVNPPARPPHAAALPASSSRPPIPQPRRTEAEPRAVQNFAYFSRHKAASRAEPGPSTSRTAARAATVVESCETPAVGEEQPRFSAAGENVGGCRSAAGIAAAASAGGKESTTYDLTYSPGCSSASASAEPAQKPPAEDRKRKGREAAAADDTEYHSEDIEFESADAKKQARGSSSTKRSRAAEVHNLSERRRRDRINEKMKALQELIPRCNKSDKASMLDEAIEYLKSLQLQVQMMSMGCSMVPMMFPGVQQYMPPMGLGMGMRMGMGLEMGMNRPMMHFPNVLPGSALPPPAPPGHIPPRFPVPSYPMPPPDQARINQSDPGLVNNPLSMQNANQQRVPNFPDPYQQYLGFHQMQFPPAPQNQGMAQPSTTRGAENRESDQLG